MKENIKITKDDIIRSIAKQTNNYICDIKEIYDVLENDIFKLLSSANENNDVYIKLFDGVTLCGKFVEEKEKKNNFTGKVQLVSSKIKPKFNITKYYCEKLNDK